MVRVVINNKIQKVLGQPLPDEITQFGINFSNMPMPIPRYQAEIVKTWCLDIVKRLNCEYVSINHTLVKTSDLKKKNSL